MICLDTNYLILGLVADSCESARILKWAQDGEQFCVSSIVWYEFLCGPITNEQEQAIRQLIKEIINFDTTMAEEGARLFNKTGRSRKIRVDAMIAAAAISRNAPIATQNVEDFARFAEFGLELI